MEQRSLISSLASFLPTERLLSSPAQLIPYESDGLTAFRQRPLAVVLPETQEEVIETVRFCHREKIPFVARGSGTSLSGGSLPIKEGIVIGLNRLNRILHLDPKERIAVVEPGVINLDISVAASNHNLYYAPDPSSQSVCTIGGNVAFNSGGAHCLKHGMTSNHVLGLKVVLPDGEIVELGGPSLESTGPDLRGLFVGSEGLFGIALEITVRLVSKPETYRTVLAAYRGLEAAGDAVGQVVAEGLLPGAMEIMDRLAIDAAEASVHAGYPQEAQALLIVELEGETPEVEAEFSALKKVIDASGTFEFRVAKDDAERFSIWKGRKGAFSAVGRLSPDFIVQDGVVPRTRLGEALAEIERLGQDFGIRVANVFHAGDGNLHPLILYDGTQEGTLEKAEELAGEIVQMCIRLGGSITGEHGVGMEKRQFLVQMFNETDIQVMKRIWHSIDPHELSNRGKMFPEVTATPPEQPAIEESTEPVSRNGLRPTTVEEVQEAIRTQKQLHARAGGSKAALSTAPEGVTCLDLSGLSGVLEYDPTEFTFIARAGTPVREIQDLLAKHGQFLPFDPVLVDSGATLGGTVAAGTSGPGRFRHGGVRDFLLGVRFVTGVGELVQGGAKVVKNAAGFDLPKLLVGSLGRLGVFVDVAFKVFPQPESYATLQLETSKLEAALEHIYELNTSSFDVEALDLEPPGKILLRIGGRTAAISSRLERIRSTLGGGDILQGKEEESLWHSTREFGWAPADSSLVKVPLTIAMIPRIEECLNATGVRRRYSVGGNLAWIAWPLPLEGLESTLSTLHLSGLVLRGSEKRVHLGRSKGEKLAKLVKRALDPQNRFPSG